MLIQFQLSAANDGEAMQGSVYVIPKLHPAPQLGQLPLLGILTGGGFPHFRRLRLYQLGCSEQVIGLANLSGQGVDRLHIRVSGGDGFGQLPAGFPEFQFKGLGFRHRDTSKSLVVPLYQKPKLLIVSLNP